MGTIIVFVVPKYRTEPGQHEHVCCSSESSAVPPNTIIVPHIALMMLCREDNFERLYAVYALLERVLDKLTYLEVKMQLKVKSGKVEELEARLESFRTNNKQTMYQNGEQLK